MVFLTCNNNDWKINDMPDYKRNVTLAFGKIKLNAGLVYSKTSGQVIGHTDLGPISTELESFNKQLNATTRAR